PRDHEPGKTYCALEDGRTGAPATRRVRRRSTRTSLAPMAARATMVPRAAVAWTLPDAKLRYGGDVGPWAIPAIPGRAIASRADQCVLCNVEPRPAARADASNRSATGPPSVRLIVDLAARPLGSRPGASTAVADRGSLGPEARFAPRDVDSGGKDDDCAKPGPSIDDFTER